jgi:hypothetical protein
VLVVVVVVVVVVVGTAAAAGKASQHDGTCRAPATANSSPGHERRARADEMIRQR